MELNQNFISTLAVALKSNKPYFEEKSIETLNWAIGSYYRRIADNISTFTMPYNPDYESAVNCIKETIKIDENGTLDMFFSSQNNFWDNRIKYLLPPKPYWGLDSIEFKQHRLGMINLEYECEAEFWASKNNEDLYKSIADFNCFDDIIKPISEYRKYYYEDFRYNTKAWKEYVFQLFSLLFNDFTFDKKRSGSAMRFLKPITDELYFGFEYDKSDNGDLLPEFVTIILLNSNFSKTLKADEYYGKQHNDILALGTLGNPFFYQPCMPMSGYVAVAMMKDLEDLTLAKGAKYVRQFQDLGDGTFKVEHPKEYGELIKRHAFYYVSALAFSSKGYLDYIEKSILDAIPTPAL